jgi:hypothetical protein
MTRKLYKDSVKQLVDTIQINFSNGAIMPSLILLYSTIDIMAWLSREKDHEKNDRGDFKGWVNSYLLPNSELDCEAIDLYAARCSILHSYTYESMLSLKGEAKAIFYTWGNADTKYAQNLINRAELPITGTVIHIDDLIGALKMGIQLFDKKLSHSPKLSKLVSDRADKFFGMIPSTLLMSNK